MNDAVAQIVKEGILGALLVIVSFALYLKDKKLTELNEKRLADRVEFQKLLSEEAANRIRDGAETRKLLMDVQAQSIEVVHKIADSIEYLEKREESARDSRRRT